MRRPPRSFLILLFNIRRFPQDDIGELLWFTQGGIPRLVPFVIPGLPKNLIFKILHFVQDDIG